MSATTAPLFHVIEVVPVKVGVRPQDEDGNMAIVSDQPIGGRPIPMLSSHSSPSGPTSRPDYKKLKVAVGPSPAAVTTRLPDDRYVRGVFELVKVVRSLRYQGRRILFVGSFGNGVLKAFIRRLGQFSSLGDECHQMWAAKVGYLFLFRITPLTLGRRVPQPTR